MRVRVCGLVQYWEKRQPDRILAQIRVADEMADTMTEAYWGAVGRGRKLQAEHYLRAASTWKRRARDARGALFRAMNPGL